MRNALIGATFAVFTLLAHDRWRRDAWRPGALLAPASLIVGLFAGETAIGALAYLVSYAIFVDEGAPRARWASLAPSFAAVAAWRVAYNLQGYGTSGSSLYIDPVREPLRFLLLAPQRLASLTMGLFLEPPADLWLWTPRSWTRAILPLACVTVGIMAWALAPALRRDRVARFWLVGALLALVPGCATFPSDRMLLLASLGAMGLVARVVAARVETTHEAASTRRERVLGLVWLGVHLCLAPFLFVATSSVGYLVSAKLAHDQRELRVDPNPELRTLVLVNAPDVVSAAYQWGVPRSGHDRLPLNVRVLTSGKPLAVTRVDESTLRIRMPQGFFDERSNGLFRPEDMRLSVGDRIVVSDFAAEVTETSPSAVGPSEVLFHFTRPLSDPGLRFVSWDGTFYRDFTVPPVGGSVSIGAL
jgi:hypothetical protein